MLASCSESENQDQTHMSIPGRDTPTTPTWDRNGCIRSWWCHLASVASTKSRNHVLEYLRPGNQVKLHMRALYSGWANRVEYALWVSSKRMKSRSGKSDMQHSLSLGLGLSLSMIATSTSADHLLSLRNNCIKNEMMGVAINQFILYYSVPILM